MDLVNSEYDFVWRGGWILNTVEFEKAFVSKILIIIVCITLEVLIEIIINEFSGFKIDKGRYAV